MKETNFKETEIGKIPVDWEVERVRDFAIIKTGSKNTQDKIDQGKYPFFVRSQTIEKINSYCFDGEAVLTAGDGVGVGKVIHYINGKFDCHQRVYMMFNFSPKILPYYFYVYFNNNFLSRMMQMTAKSSVDSVRMDMISEMPIPLPPLPEQEKIAAVLSDTDLWIESTEALLTKKRLIKKAAMQKLLAPKEDWEVRKLGEVGEIKKGQLITGSTKIEGEIPVIAGGKSPAYFHKFSNRTGKTITVSASGANAGYVNFHSIPIFASDCSTIGESETYSIEYIYFCLLNLQELIYGYQTGGAQPHIHPKDLNPIEIPFPPLKTQQEIAEILSAMDLEIESLENRLQKARQLKQGMMQDLLTGKVRLG